MREVILFGGKYSKYDELVKFIMEKDEEYKKAFIYATTMLPLEEVKLLAKGKSLHIERPDFYMDFNVENDRLDLDYTIDCKGNTYNVSLSISLPECSIFDSKEISTLTIDNLSIDESLKMEVSLERVNTKDALVIHSNKLKEGKSNSVSFKKIFFEKNKGLNTNKR